MDLLQMSPAGGCACKLPIDRMNFLRTLLDGVPATGDMGDASPFDIEFGEDAALYSVSADLSLAASVDFGTPVSSSPETWGEIATHNSLSDIYAMGGRPFVALSILGWPSKLGDDAVTGMIKATVRTLSQSCTKLVGGHSIESDVPILGLCVLGYVQQEHAMLISNVKPGDYLILTKPIGTGIIVGGQRHAVASTAAVAVAERVMTTSNRLWAELAVKVGIDAATDVTGYGLIGHLRNMLLASGCSADVDASRIPILSDAIEIMNLYGVVPNSTERNYLSLDRHVTWSGIPMTTRMAMSDPQTSGGLLLAATHDEMTSFMARCAESGLHATIFGRVKEDAVGTITVV